MTHRPAPTLDVEDVRSRFPSLERTVGGRRVAFFDGPGGSQTPREVVDAISGYLLRSNANEGGAFITSHETGELLEVAHASAAAMVGADSSEIVFGANMTTLNFLLVHAFARTLSPGDEVVVTQLDHEANVSPWLLAAQDFGFNVRCVPMSADDGLLDLDALEALVGPRTKAVAFTLASNATGGVPDARRVIAAAHAVGALAWADAVHAAPHRRIDRSDLDLDVVLCSPYKFFGPHLGIAAIRRDLAETLPADRVRPAALMPPGHRFETGTLSHEALAGMVAAIDYLAGLGGSDQGLTDRLDAAFAAISAHEGSLSERFLRSVAEIQALRVCGTSDPTRVGDRTPTFLMELGGYAPGALAAELGDRGFFAWHGDFYAPGAIRGVNLGPQGGVRIGFLHYNTAAEVDALVDTLVELADR